MTNKTTKADFKYFKARCEHYIKIWGLDDWDIYYQHSEANGDYKGKALLDSNARQATIILGLDWDYFHPTKKRLDNTAKHEVIHVLLAVMDCLISARYITKDEETTSTHYVIQKLMKLLPNR